MNNDKFIPLPHLSHVRMRQLVTILILLTQQAVSWAANGDYFKVKTIEGVEMQFNVISESAKTCQVRAQYYSAISINTKGTVTIPESANGYKVITIGRQAFTDCKFITEVSIPGTVTSIEDEAFNRCYELTSLVIPKSVKTIGSSTNSFMNIIKDCGKLSSLSVESGNTVFESPNNCNAIIEKSTKTLIVGCASTVIPSSVQTIGHSAFSGCSGLKSINIPYGVTKIEVSAFMNCTGLETVTLPNSLTWLDQHSFTGCSSLQSITIPKSVSTYIGVNALSNCSKLKNIIVESGNSRYDSRDNCNAIIETRKNSLIIGCGNSTIPSTVTSISFNAFNNCKSLESLVIPSSVTNIDKQAFSNSGLKYLKIMNGLTTLNSEVFYTCHNLRSVELPASISSIDNSAFYNCDSLETITVSSDNPVYDSRNNCNAVIETATNTLVLGTKNTVIPNSVTTIGYYAFTYSTMESMTIPENVTKIDTWGFAFCYRLKKLIFKGDIPKEIGASCFSGVGMQTPCIMIVPSEYLDNYSSAFKDNKFYGGTFTLQTPAQPVCFAEYFINNDPGIGKANSVYAKEGNIDFNLSTDEMKIGVNIVGFRPAYQNEENEITYGSTHYQYVYRHAANGQRDIERIEYFWDEDPGKGNGTAIPFNIDGENALVQSNINYQGLYGSHVLNVRAMSHGVWSTLYQQAVILPIGILSGEIVLDPNVTENADEGIFGTLSSLLGALSTRGFDIGLNVNVADATYNFMVTEQSIAVVQALYQYLIKMNFYISMKAPNSATFNFIIPEDFMYAHQEELPQIAAAVQAMFSHIVTENISVLINGQVYQYDGFQVEPNDLLALKNIYNRLNGENWTEKKWSFLSNGRDAAEFPGVEFNAQGRVTSINLYNNNLSGVLNGEWHLEMPYLTYLNLSYNDIEGDLSPFLRYTTGLKSLYMTNNCMTEISDTLPGSLTTINLKYQFKTGYSNSELKEKFLEKQQARRFYISNKQQLDIPSLFTYNHKYMDHSTTPTVYLLDRTSNHNSFAYYTNQYGFAWKSSEEYTDVQDARYLVELSGGTGISDNSVIPMNVRYVEGDANMSGATDVLDVQHTLNRILGSVWNFNYSAANTYTDKTINVQDIVCTVNIILAQEQSTVAGSRGEQAVNTPEAWLYTSNGQLLLAASKEVGAIDVELSGVSTSQVSLLLNHSHFQMIGRNTEQGARFIIFSPTGQAIPAGELNSLLRLSSHAEIITAKIADITADEVSVALGSEPTSIGQVRDGMMTARFQGNQLFINAASEMNNVGLRLTSTSGAVVFSTVLGHVVRGETTLNINVVPGVYILELSNAGGARKIVKLIKR